MSLRLWVPFSPEHAVDRLHTAVQTAPVLLRVTPDASGDRFRIVLQQHDPREWNPFKPVFRGQVSSMNRGTLVEGGFRLATSTIVLSSIWVTLAIAFLFFVFGTLVVSGAKFPTDPGSLVIVVTSLVLPVLSVLLGRFGSSLADHHEPKLRSLLHTALEDPATEPQGDVSGSSPQVRPSPSRVQVYARPEPLPGLLRQQLPSRRAVLVVETPAGQGLVVGSADDVAVETPPEKFSAAAPASDVAAGTGMSGREGAPLPPSTGVGSHPDVPSTQPRALAVTGKTETPAKRAPVLPGGAAGSSARPGDEGTAATYWGQPSSGRPVQSLPQVASSTSGSAAEIADLRTPEVGTVPPVVRATGRGDGNTPPPSPAPDVQQDPDGRGVQSVTGPRQALLRRLRSTAGRSREHDAALPTAARAPVSGMSAPAGPSAAGPSAAGPSAAGPSAAGPSAGTRHEVPDAEMPASNPWPAAGASWGSPTEDDTPLVALPDISQVEEAAPSPLRPARQAVSRLVDHSRSSSGHAPSRSRWWSDQSGPDRLQGSDPLAASDWGARYGRSGSRYGSVSASPATSPASALAGPAMVPPAPQGQPAGSDDLPTTQRASDSERSSLPVQVAPVELDDVEFDIVEEDLFDDEETTGISGEPSGTPRFGTAPPPGWN